MLLLLILTCAILFGAISMIVAAVIGGGVLFVMFGDVIVFVAIVTLIVKLIRRCRCKGK